MGDVNERFLSQPTVAIHQPNYLPWIGYFHKMSLVDVFVFLDDVQFPQGSANCFCARVKIKGNQGGQWLTVPVHNTLGKRINEVAVAGTKWATKHIRTIEQLYGRAKHFDAYWPMLRGVLQQEHTSLCEFNIRLIASIAGMLELSVTFRRSSEFRCERLAGEERVLAILREMNADTYVTGQGKGAERYINDASFSASGMSLKLQEFEHPVYEQFYGDFEPYMSIIDLLFHDGKRFFERSECDTRR
jgi:hypothetical protein